MSEVEEIAGGVLAKNLPNLVESLWRRIDHDDRAVVVGCHRDKIFFTMVYDL